MFLSRFSSVCSRNSNAVRDRSKMLNSTSVSDNFKSSSNVAKSTAMGVLFTLSFFFGCLPIKLSRVYKWNSSAKNNDYVKMLLGCGGGVLLCTTFLHLLPEVSEMFDKLELTPDTQIHYAELMMCVGFFLMYFVEECIHLYLDRAEKNIKTELFRTSLSIRRGELNRSDLSDSLKSIQKESVYDPHTHQHSHVDIMLENASHSTKTAIRGLLVVLALSVHELFEGLAVGLESTPNKVWYLLAAVSAHKLVIAFCIGVELVTSDMKILLVVIYVFTFAVVSPIGIGLGIVVSNINQTSMNIVSVFLQGLASGTLLYVVFFEILQAEKKSGMKQYLSILTGFMVMFTITLFD